MFEREIIRYNALLNEYREAIERTRRQRKKGVSRQGNKASSSK